jgi:hypothetical protein
MQVPFSQILFCALPIVLGSSTIVCDAQTTLALSTEYTRLGNQAIAQTSQPYDVFSDTNPVNDPLAGYPNYMYIQGITTGCAAGTFCPTQNITRAQVAVFVIRGIFVSHYGANQGDNFTFGATPYFTDVPTGSFGFNWIQKLYELGITSGCAGTPGNLQFCPNDDIPNEQIAVWVMRARVYASTTWVPGQPPPPPPATYSWPYPTCQVFVDEPVTGFGFTAAQALAGLGVITPIVPATSQTPCPTPQGNFNGTNVITREQMAVYVVRAILNQFF